MTTIAPPGRDTAGRVCAVVVTRERRELLRMCLQALREERRPPDGVLVVDNASADGTADMVREEFPEAEVLRLEHNVGGAGGFHRGMAHAHAQGYEWLWVMDDDTLARGDTLQTLLEGAGRAPGEVPLLVASQVRWKDERLHPMNVPVPRWRAAREMAEGVAQRLLALRYTTFVSVAVHRDAVDRYGLPLAHYFIWGDDVEYTARVLRDQPGYLVPDSVVYHWTPEPHPAAGATSDRFYFHARNGLFLLRGTALRPIERVDYARFYLRSILTFIRVNRASPRHWRMLGRALRDGMRGTAR